MVWSNKKVEPPVNIGGTFEESLEAISPQGSKLLRIWFGSCEVHICVKEDLSKAHPTPLISLVNIMYNQAMEGSTILEKKPVVRPDLTPEELAEERRDYVDNMEQIEKAMALFPPVLEEN